MRNLFRRAALGLAAFATISFAACSAPAPLDMPSWMGDGRAWRAKLPAAVEQRLDLPMARYIREYRSLSGAANYREFVVQSPKTLADVTAAMEEALVKAGRKGTRRDVTNMIDGETRIDWILPDKRVVMLVYLSNMDLDRDDEPAYALMFEPK